MSKNIKDTQALAKLSADKLQKELRDAQTELFETRMKKGLGELKEVHQLRELRRYVARIKTFLSNPLTK